MPLTLRIDNRNNLPAAARERLFAACGGTIGRTSDNDWVLPDEHRYISSRHAVIDFQAGAYYLVDTSRNGVFVNGADTPVGHGHPQRLFDGDRLRMGDLEISVVISGNDADIPDDGMRDSIVRAQLVAEEPSVELMLVSEENLLGDGHLLQHHLAPGTDLVRQAPAPSQRATAAVAQAAKPQSAPPAEGGRPATPDTEGDLQRAAALLLAAAGVPPGTVAGTTPAETLQMAGRLLRMTVAGVMDLLHETAAFRTALQIPAPRFHAGQKNPLRVSSGPAEALQSLLADRGDNGYLAAHDAIEEAVRDLQQHGQATRRAIVEGAVDYSERFDPQELRQDFEKGLKRGGLLGQANKLRYWDLYTEAYAELSRRDEGAPPRLFSESFASAYSAELESPRTRRQR
jgi:predicted component of type VI protein secretion system